MAVTRLTTNGLTGTKYDIASADNYYMEPIATTLLGSTASSVIFSNIPQGYKHLQIRVFNKTNRADQNDAMQIQLNSDTGSNYNNHHLYGDGSAANAGAVDTPGSGLLVWLIAGNNSTNAWAGTIVDLLDYTNTNKFKTMRALTGYDNNGNGIVGISSGAWRNTASITAIELKPRYGTSFNTNSRFSLYGIKA